MSTALTAIGDLLPVFAKEARRRKLALGTLFAVIAIAALAIGIALPRKFESSTTILVQESNIVTGLMEGRAIATGIADRAGIAREVIFSRKVMNEILDIGGWMARTPAPSALEQDRLIENITKMDRYLRAWTNRRFTQAAMTVDRINAEARAAGGQFMERVEIPTKAPA